MTPPLLRLVLAGFASLIPMAIASSVFSAQLSCDQWNRGEFFRKADAATVSHCLDIGADIHVRDEHGSMPLHNAAGDTEYPAVIAILLEAGADLNAQSGWYESTPLHHAAAHNNNPEVINTPYESRGRRKCGDGVLRKYTLAFGREKEQVPYGNNTSALERRSRHERPRQRWMYSAT